jgi:hypothetical protein
MLDCAYQVICCWEQFNEIIAEMARPEDDQWLYRGQNDDWPLTTAIERGLLGWSIPLARNLKDMNISFAALLPGLDGFAKSINQQIRH